MQTAQMSLHRWSGSMCPEVLVSLKRTCPNMDEPCGPAKQHKEATYRHFLCNFLFGMMLWRQIGAESITQ